MAPRNLVAMYHYVRPRDSDGVTGLRPEAFDAQLEAIGRRYRFVGAQEFVATQDREHGMALVTFDDAVADQYDVAFGILERRGVPSVIFAPMRPFSGEADRWTTQHLLHALAQELGWDELERRVDALIGAVAIDTAAMDRLYHYEVPRKRRLKYLFAFTLGQPAARAVLTEINAAVGLRAEDWFVTAEQLVEVQRAGHTVGGHGFEHVAYDTLTRAEQAADLRRAHEQLTALCGERPRPMSFPFGATTPATAALARQAGWTYGFTTAERVDANRIDATLAQAP